MAKPKSIYSGVLNTPMVPFLPTLSDGILGYSEPGVREKADRMDRAQIKERLAALDRHYQIDRASPMADVELVFKLARVHVPGFQYHDPGKRGRGRSGKWKDGKSLELYADVKALIRLKPEHSASGACRILAETKKYSARYKGEKHKNLLRRYHGALSAARPKKEAPESFMGGVVHRLLSRGGLDDDWAIAAFAMKELGGKY